MQIHIFVIRGAHLARSIIENTCLEGLDRIFRQTFELWTSRGHYGRSIALNYISLVVDGLELWPFENFSHNVIMTLFVIARASRPNKQRAFEQSIHLTFT